jgi:two-component system LytT family response regulator
MVRAVIIDDEPKNLRILTKLLEKFCPEVSVIGLADGGQKGIEVIRSEKPNLVFLDIEMPYGNAFDMLDKLQPVDFEIIFVTAFDNYSLKAFRYNALDYLLKPVDIEELKKAVGRATERITSKKIDLMQLELLVNRIARPEQGINKLALPSGAGLIFIPIADIIRCESKGGYTHFYRRSADKIISSRHIKEYEDLLPGSIFCRVHNSHIINLHFVEKYHKGRGGYVEMTDGAMIEVAIRRKDEFLAHFGLKS